MGRGGVLDTGIPDVSVETAVPQASHPSRAQMRGARGMLGWSVLDLAKAAQVSVSTVKRMEMSGAPVSEAASVRVYDALRMAGLRFSADGKGEGVWLNRR